MGNFSMEQIVANPWLAAGVILVTQIIFLYCRTLNVIYTAEKKIIPSILTGNMIGITWLIGIAIGASAIMSLQWQPVLAHLIGGTVGTYWGFKTKRK